MSLPAPIPVYFLQLGPFEAATGLTADAVQKLIQRGEWIEGVHYRRRSGRLYVDLRGYDAWVAGQQQVA